MSKCNEKAQYYVSQGDKWETKEDDMDVAVHDQLCEGIADGPCVADARVVRL